jgi:hypothetical protein
VEGRFLTFESRLKNNKLVIIDALGITGGLQTGRRLEESVRDFTIHSSPDYCSRYVVQSLREFGDILDNVAEDCAHGMKPIIHIEAHGDSVKGLKMADSEQMLSWVDLYSRLSQINQITENNMGVVVASCFGLYAIKPMRITAPTPFYFLMGSEFKVPAGTVADTMTKFYRVLFESSSYDLAALGVDKKFTLFHSETFFFTMMSRHIKKACLGAGALRRAEERLTYEVGQGRISNTAELRVARKHAKESVKMTPERFYASANLFLHRRTNVEFENVMKFVRGY